MAAGLAAPALVGARGVPRDGHGVVTLTFARQGFVVVGSVPLGPPSAPSTPPPGDVVAALAALVAPRLPRVARVEVHGWVPDTDAGNVRAAEARALAGALAAALTPAHADAEATLPPAPVAGTSDAGAPAPRTPGTAAPAEDWLVQLCLLPEGLVHVGVAPATDALSTAVGGRSRTHVSARAPARSAMKLAEAFEWVGVGPGPGEVAVDLGAAPGGWTSLLLERRARVIAVDPARMSPTLARDRRLQHVQASAFEFAPDEPVDWLCCDMAWRPLEVAQLLARWARQGWASLLLANIKLPMKQKVAILARVRATLEGGGWRDLRMRHLYHDRDEITVFARC